MTCSRPRHELRASTDDGRYPAICVSPWRPLRAPNAYSPDRSRRRNRNGTLRGLLILVARLTAREHKGFFSLCHYFAIMKPVQRNESRHLGQNEMAGLKGKS